MSAEDKQRQEQAQEQAHKERKLPLDAKLLADAVIELNISRRSVGLYPTQHPITRQAIRRAYELLSKLFELRSQITLGVARDVLVVDEYTLERRNPVFREFALAVHERGLAAIVFRAGLQEEELVLLHGLLTQKEGPTGKALAEEAQRRGLRHLVLQPLELERLAFHEGARAVGTPGAALWEDYVHGLIEGTLAEPEEGALYEVPPEELAQFISEHMPQDAPEEAYDRVITAYLRRKGSRALSPEASKRFMSFLEGLSPELKAQFLQQTLEGSLRPQEAEQFLRNLGPEDVQALAEAFKDRATMPESIRNLLGKLSEAAPQAPVVLFKESQKALVHDILEERLMELFREDHFEQFVQGRYQWELGRMLEAAPLEAFSPLAREAQEALQGEALEGAFTELLLELTHFEHLSRQEYLGLLGRLSELCHVLMDTGRFEALVMVYNTLYSQSLQGRFQEEAKAMIEYFFFRPDFQERLLQALRLWGRLRRAEAQRLLWPLRHRLIGPLLDALAEEKEASVRRFFLQLLASLGRDVLPEALRRLQDERWYVVRNMLYLLRACGGAEHVKKLRPFLRHKDRRVRYEALRGLLEFKAPDGPSYLKEFLRSKEPWLRQQGIKLAGAYRVEAALPYLAEVLRARDPLGGLYEEKLLAVRALAELGSPRALPAIKELLSSRRLLYRRPYQALKLEALRSLSRYPRGEAEPLIRWLLQQPGSEELKALAQEMLKAGGSRG